jgi:hypothetical protein
VSLMYILRRAMILSNSRYVHPACFIGFSFPNKCLLPCSPELGWDVLGDNPKRVESFQLFLFLFHKFVFPEMLDILGMCQILELGVFVVVLLPMVNFVLIFVVAVVSRTSSHIRQSLAFVDEHDKLVARYGTGAIRVKQGQNLPRYLSPTLRRDVLVRVVIEAVGSQNFFRLPFAVAIEVVQQEEGGRIEIAYVVFLCALVLVTC